MSRTSRTAQAALLALALALVAPACDDADGNGPSDATDTTSSDALASDTGAPADTVAPTDTVTGLEFACGALLTCEVVRGCASRGQGACIGPAPDENGQCAANCSSTNCGGSDHCLCDTYWCVELPMDCTSCSCATAPDASCTCDDSDGHVRFSCMGA